MSKESTNQMLPRLHYVMIWVVGNCFYCKKVPEVQLHIALELYKDRRMGGCMYTWM